MCTCTCGDGKMSTGASVRVGMSTIQKCECTRELACIPVVKERGEVPLCIVKA